MICWFSYKLISFLDHKGYPFWSFLGRVAYFIAFSKETQNSINPLLEKFHFHVFGPPRKK